VFCNKTLNCRGALYELLTFQFQALLPAQLTALVLLKLHPVGEQHSCPGNACPSLPSAAASYSSLWISTADRVLKAKHDKFSECCHLSPAKLCFPSLSSLTWLICICCAATVLRNTSFLWTLETSYMTVNSQSQFKYSATLSVSLYVSR
jgi:hypothetical protein